MTLIFTASFFKCKNFAIWYKCDESLNWYLCSVSHAPSLTQPRFSLKKKISRRCLSMQELGKKGPPLFTHGTDKTSSWLPVTFTKDGYEASLSISNKKKNNKCIRFYVPRTHICTHMYLSHFIPPNVMWGLIFLTQIWADTVTAWPMEYGRSLMFLRVLSLSFSLWVSGCSPLEPRHHYLRKPKPHGETHMEKQGLCQPAAPIS